MAKLRASPGASFLRCFALRPPHRAEMIIEYSSRNGTHVLFSQKNFLGHRSPESFPRQSNSRSPASTFLRNARAAPVSLTKSNHWSGQLVGDDPAPHQSGFKKSQALSLRRANYCALSDTCPISCLLFGSRQVKVGPLRSHD